MEFSKLEKDVLISIYNGTVNTDDIAEELCISYKKIDRVKTRILKKLNTNNWHNAIRVSFSENILDKSRYQTLNIDNEVNETIKVINDLDIKLFNNENEFKMEIYNKLINLFNKFEYNLLLR